MNCRECGTPLPAAYQLGVAGSPIGMHRFEQELSLLVSCPTCQTWALVKLNGHGAFTEPPPSAPS